MAAEGRVGPPAVAPHQGAPTTPIPMPTPGNLELDAFAKWTESFKASMDKFTAVTDGLSKRVEELQTNQQNTTQQKPPVTQPVWPQKTEDYYLPKDSSKFTEFEKKYPPDRYGEECSDNARVWSIYRDRANEDDHVKVDGWHKSLDIHLIFAGLFSAIATAFLIESYQLLQPDYNEIMARAFIAVQENRTITKPEDFKAPILAQWINGLWFVSLSLALGVAFLAILAKGWLSEYSSRMRSQVASSRKWAWRHMVYKAGLRKWGVDGFMSALPLLMHVSLCLFFAGMVLFLWEISVVIALVIAAGNALVVAFYVAAFVMPLWYGDCPTATPLLRRLYRVFQFLRRLLDNAFRRFVQCGRHRNVDDLPLRSVQVPHGGMIFSPPAWRTSFRRFNARRPGGPPPAAYDEVRLLAGNSAQRDADALRWMVARLPAMDEVDVALDSLGVLDVEHHGALFGQEYEGDRFDSQDIRQACIDRFGRLLRASGEMDPAAVGRCLQTIMFLNITEDEIGIPGAFVHMCRRWGDIRTYDVPLMLNCLFMSTRSQVLPDSVDQRELWARPPIIPCKASTLTLMIAYRDDWRLVDLLNLYSCGSIGFTDAADSSRALFRRTLPLVLDRIEADVQQRANVSPLPLEPIPVVEESADIRFRALVVLGYALANAGPLRLASDAPALANVYGRCLTSLHEKEGVIPVSLPLLERYLSYLATPDFVGRQWATAPLWGGASRLRMTFMATTNTYWSSTFGEIVRQTLNRSLHAHAIALGNLPRQVSSGLVLLTQTIGKYANCTDVVADLRKYPSAEAAICESRINVLLHDVVNGAPIASVWRQTSNYHRFHLFGLHGLGRDVIFALSALHRSGIDVSTLFNELFRADFAVELISALPRYGFEIAQHAKEISPQWWAVTSEKLLVLPHDRWRFKEDYAGGRAFVEAVNDSGACTKCTAPIIFPGVQPAPMPAPVQYPIPLPHFAFPPPADDAATANGQPPKVPQAQRSAVFAPSGPGAQKLLPPVVVTPPTVVGEDRILGPPSGPSDTSSSLV